ncbi:agamous-like MADS-box protein AGL82 [Manihot esculenta]|uniref:MADS-box domain-containing protein n=1 Tax=Manihot esculenta TaxID=3983 RepID=A0A2C9UGQ9_MANES|nr:agamous-like MADS-box protein AGL82 [Manihot esculenta]OAY29648.1 hypothetical protein MANES_15G161100v8 [Manihot esculenta]
MGHSRIKMELIRKESTRMNTFQKRKKSLLKKISEFSILCGVEACLIIFGPKQKDEQVIKLEATWPSNPDEIKRIINKYKKTDQARRCYQVSDYFADKKKKVDMEISKLHKQIYEVPLWDVRLDGFLEDQLQVLIAQLDKKIEVADRKLDRFQENQILMDEFATRMLYSSQIMENYMNRSNSVRNFSNFHHLFSDVMPLPVNCFLPGQSSYMIPSNSNLQIFSDYQTSMSIKLMDRNSYSSNLANLQLQPFSDPKPLGVQLQMHSQQIQSSPGTATSPNFLEDLTTMAKDQYTGNQYGVRTNSNVPSFPSLSYLNPSPLMWDNVTFNNADASSGNIGSSLQTILPRMQLPMSSFSDQMSHCQEDNFSSNIGSGKIERIWK